jgi:hypothetical protein
LSKVKKQQVLDSSVGAVREKQQVNSFSHQSRRHI